MLNDRSGNKRKQKGHRVRGVVVTSGERAALTAAGAGGTRRTDGQLARRAPAPPAYRHDAARDAPSGGRVMMMRYTLSWTWSARVSLPWLALPRLLVAASPPGPLPSLSRRARPCPFRVRGERRPVPVRLSALDARLLAWQLR